MPMPVKISESELPGVLLVEGGIVRDDRGYFAETYSAKTFAEAGLESRFVQDNLSASRRGPVRGLHYQLEPYGMGKLVRAFTGAVFDVAVDLRRGSPTFGRWIGRELTPENRLALFIPSGFAHGFVGSCITSAPRSTRPRRSARFITRTRTWPSRGR
jgi:dTDP-4-dehydrorhamnose 3,5-epimerase